MLAPLAKFLDWSAVQATTLMLPANFYRNDPRLEEALEFLNGPESFPNESQPPQVEFSGPRDFHFPTPRPCEFTVSVTPGSTGFQDHIRHSIML